MNPSIAKRLDVPCIAYCFFNCSSAFVNNSKHFLLCDGIIEMMPCFHIAFLFRDHMAFFIPPPNEMFDNSNLLAITEEAISSTRNDYNSKERVNDFFEKTIPRLSDDEFRMHFRLSRSSFQNLIEILGADITKLSSFEKKMLLFLRFLGTQETLESMSMSFDLTISSAWVAIREIISILKSSGFISTLIRFPSDLNSIAQQFQIQAHGRFPATFIGAIDCKEVQIQKPVQNCEAYYNRKSSYSVKLQATVDAHGNFCDVFIGWPGKTNDSRVFRNSPIYQNLNSGQFGNGFMLIGDSAYPSSTSFVCTPFKRIRGINLPDDKVNFNAHLSSLRQIVECAFGRTTERWRRMKFVYVRDMRDICDIILSCCALHNYCQDEGNEELEWQYNLNDASDDDSMSDDNISEQDEVLEIADSQAVSDNSFRCRNDIFEFFVNH